MSPLLLAGLILVSVAGASRVVGDDTPSADEDRAEQIERQTKRGWAAFRRGTYDEALQRMDRLEKVDPKNPLPRLLRARIFARTGKYAEALALATEASAAHPDDRGLEALRFDLLRRMGRHDEATTAAKAALAVRPDDLVARTVLGLLLEERGRRTEALAEYDKAIDAYNAKDPLPEELSFVAQAAIRTTWLSPNPKDDLLPGALKILGKRIQADEEDTDALLVYADLFQSTRGQNGQRDARKYYKKLLAANPTVAEAHVGLARTAMMFWDEEEATSACERALKTDPSHVPAMNILARLNIGDGDYEKADDLWKKAIAVNPTDREAKALHAARLYVAGDREGFEKAKKEILDWDPTYGALWWITAQLMGERRRRYDEAAELSAKAIAVDPRDQDAYMTHAVNLMNVGKEKEARASFEKSEEVAKGYDDVMRTNFLQALDVVDKFRRVKTEHFVVGFNTPEGEVLEPYALPLLEQAWRDLEKKYEFTPEGPILTEFFHRHDDLSARAIGVKNFPGLLGICFGKVFLVEGPLAGPAGYASWAQTAWHEYAHIVTLQMSKGQVPKWLTEGLSVHEESAHKPTWRRPMERELFDRWKNGKLIPLSELSHSFRGGDIGFAYYSGGLAVDFIVETWGFDAIRRMLRRFGDDVPEGKVFEEVLKVPLDEYDRRFREHVVKMVGDYKMVPRWDEANKKAFEDRTRKDPKDAEAWTRLAWCHAQRRNRVDAGAALERALSLAPNSPDVILLQAEMAMQAGLEETAKEHYERFLATGSDDVGCRLALARMAAKGKDGYAKAVEQLEAAKRCFPRFVGKGNPYVELARLHTAAGKPDLATKELEAYAALAFEDYAVRKELASRYEATGDDDGLLRVCEEMVEINPFGAELSEPPDLDLHPRYAKALNRKGRKDEAAREWKVQVAVLQRERDDDRRREGLLEARIERARMLLALGKAEDALDEANAALSLDPNSEAARDLRQKALDAGGFK